MNAFSKIDTAPAIGTALISPGAGLCYIVDVQADTGPTFTIIGGPSPMSRNLYKITIANDAGHMSEMSEHIAAPMIARAAHVEPISAERAAELLESAKVKRAEDRALYARQAEERESATAQARADLERFAPPWAKSAIIAELHEDACEFDSDYHNHKTLRVVVIGWSKHSRDLFPEMRKAASTFEPTADLATAPESAEHREKYSMGAGFYLKTGYRDDSGWCVKKTSIGGLARPGLEFSDTARGLAQPPEIVQPAKACPPIAAIENPPPSVEISAGFYLSEHVHTKKGFKMWIASMSGRVDREEFDHLLSAARALGGWYSRPWGGTPGGFAFKIEDKARAFVAANQIEG